MRRGARYPEAVLRRDQGLARQDPADRRDGRLGEVGEIAEVLVAHPAAFAIGAAQQVGDVDAVADILRLDCGYVN